MIKTHKKIIPIILLILIQTIKADLPIHCLKNQVTGYWILQRGKIEATNNERKMVSCGHQSPDNENTSYKALNGKLDVVENEEIIKINPDFTVSGDKGTGKWTLIYDEGWEIDYNNTKYTHFFKYYNQNGNYKTDCDNTLVGWFNSYSVSQRGCSIAKKKDQMQNNNNVNETAPKNLSIVQPKNIEKKPSTGIFDDNDGLFGQKNTKKNSIYNNDLFDENKSFYNDNKDDPLFKKKDDLFKKNDEILNKHNDYSWSSENNSSYYYSFSQLQSTKSSKHLSHEQIITKLNSIKGKTWKAGLSKNFEGFSMQKMNTYAGSKRHQQKHHINKKEVFSFAQINKNNVQYSHFSRENLSDLPKNFDWVKDSPRVIEQKDCGSCYAIATTNMLTARNKITNRDNVQFSAQHSLDCNYYNQGCQGGYGFLTSKFFSEFELVPESCHPYRATNGSCNTCDVDKLEYVYRVTDYGYIGGAYGKCSERLMMEEIHKNGPIVVSFEPAMDFMYYQEGIYHSVDANDWILGDEDKLPQWEKVDHSVLCVGWGENEDGKYWLVQNSWGEDWGEKGYFKIRRGTDESNIESMGERAFIKKEKRQKVFLQKQSKY